jgi:cytoskeletal protein CcmA (bactofilin family)
MRGWRFLIAVVVVIGAWALLAPQRAAAADFKSGTSPTIAATQTIDDDLYITGNEVTIAGRVTGDVIAAASTIKVTGQIGGSLQVLAGTVEIDGDVAHSVRTATGDLKIGGDVGGDVLVASGSLTLKSSGSVAGDVYVAGGDVELSGPVGGDVRGNAGNLTIDAPVAGAVDVTASQVDLGAKARIGKNLIYESKNDATTQSGSTVVGRTERTEPNGSFPGDSAISWVSNGLVRLLCALVAGLVVIVVLPRGMAAVADAARLAPISSFLIGLLLFWLLPIALGLLLITLVGAPVALIGFALYFIALYLSQVVLGLALGRLILPKSWDSASRGYNLLAMTIGVIILAAIRMIPVPLIGVIVAGLTAVFALGAIVVAIRAARRTQLVTAQ